MEREDLSEKEKLKKAIILRIKSFTERSRLMDDLLFSFSPEQREKYTPALNKVRYNMFKTFSQIIIKTLGLDNEMAASELTLNLNGLIKEVTFIAGEDMISLKDGPIADFIIDSLEAIAQQRKGKKLLFTQEQLNELKRNFEDDGEYIQAILRKKYLLQSLRGLLDEYDKTAKQEKLQEAEKILVSLKDLELSEKGEDLYDTADSCTK